MSSLRTRLQEWDGQPQEAVPLNTDNPLASGLVGVIASVGRRSHYFGGGELGGSASVDTASVRHAGGVVGKYYAGTHWHSGPSLNLASQTAVTVIGLHARQGAAGNSYSGPFGIGSSSPTISLESSTGNPGAPGVYFSAWSSSGTRSNLGVLSGAELGPQGVLQAVAVRVAGARLSGYYDGRKLGEAAGPATLRTFGSLEAGRSQSLRYDAMVPFVAAWARALSDAEIAAVSANPWQLFEPRRIWVPVAAAGGGGIPVAVFARNRSQIFGSGVR